MLSRLHRATRAFVALALLATATAGAATPAHYQVHGTMILDPDGNQFVAKGANINGYNSAWGGPTLEHLPLFKDVWKFNFARIYNRINPAYNGFNKDKQYLYDVIDAYTAAGIVVMPEVHDRTGYFFEPDSVPSIDDLIAFWVDLAERYQDNPRVWFNVMNEPDSRSTALTTPRWESMHREVIAAIRATGARNLIVLDGDSYAQESGVFNNNPVRTENSALLTYGPAMLDWHEANFGDRNLAFGVHFYREWVWGDEKMIDFLDRVEAAGLAVLVGEYGIYTNNDTRPAMYSMGRVAFPRNIGRVAWHWLGGDRNDMTTSGNGGAWHIDRTDGTKPTNLSEFGEFVWADNHAPAIDTQAPWPVTGLDLIERTSSSLTLDWQPARDNFGVVAYDVYVEDTLATTVTTAGAQLGGLDPATDYLVTVRARDAAGNVSEAGAPFVAATRPAGPVMNLVVDGDFESAALNRWSRQNASGSAAAAASGARGLRLGNAGVAAASAEQTLSGLAGDTRYTVTALLRVTGPDAAVTLSVADFGGEAVAVTVTATEWTPVRLTFTTAPDTTTATLRLATPADSRAAALADDLAVILH